MINQNVSPKHKKCNFLIASPDFIQDNPEDAFLHVIRPTDILQELLKYNPSLLQMQKLGHLPVYGRFVSASPTDSILVFK